MAIVKLEGVTTRESVGHRGKARKRKGKEGEGSERKGKEGEGREAVEEGKQCYKIFVSGYPIGQNKLDIVSYLYLLIMMSTVAAYCYRQHES